MHCCVVFLKYRRFWRAWGIPRSAVWVSMTVTHFEIDLGKLRFIASVQNSSCWPGVRQRADTAIGTPTQLRT
jgi:hypothetical protein